VALNPTVKVMSVLGRHAARRSDSGADSTRTGRTQLPRWGRRRPPASRSGRGSSLTPKSARRKLVCRTFRP